MFNEHLNIRQIDDRFVAVRFGIHTNLDLIEVCSVQVHVRVTHLEWDVTTEMLVQFWNANASAVRQAKWGVQWYGYKMTAIGQEILYKTIKVIYNIYIFEWYNVSHYLQCV